MRSCLPVKAVFYLRNAGFLQQCSFPRDCTLCCPSYATLAFRFLYPAVLHNLLTSTSTLSLQSRHSFAIFKVRLTVAFHCPVPYFVWSLVHICPDSELVQGVKTPQFRLVLCGLISFHQLST